MRQVLCANVYISNPVNGNYATTCKTTYKYVGALRVSVIMLIDL